MEIEVLCNLLDQLIVTDVSHLPSADEELLCRFFDRLSITDDESLLPTIHHTSPVEKLCNLKHSWQLSVGQGFCDFSWAPVFGLPWRSLQAHFDTQGYSVGPLFLGRQLKRDFFLFISHSGVRQKNDWLAFGYFEYFEDVQRWRKFLFYILWRYRTYNKNHWFYILWRYITFGMMQRRYDESNIMCYILWRYRKFDLPPAPASASPPPVFSHVHGDGRFFIHVLFNLVIVCCLYIFSFLFTCSGKDHWFYILWGYKTFGKNHCRLLRRYISSSPSRQQQAQPPSSVSCNLFRHGKFLRRVLCLPTRDYRDAIGLYYLRRILCLSTRGNKWFKHGTAPVLWMVWFVCAPSSPMVYNGFRSLLYPSNLWLFLWKVGEAEGIPAFNSLHVRRSLQLQLQQFSPRRQLKSRTRGNRHCNNANQCVNGLSRQPRNLNLKCLSTYIWEYTYPPFLHATVMDDSRDSTYPKNVPVCFFKFLI